MSPSRPTYQPLAVWFSGLWLLSVSALSVAIAATPLYQPGYRLGLCASCEVSTTKTMIAKIEPAKAG